MFRKFGNPNPPFGAKVKAIHASLLILALLVPAHSHAAPINLSKTVQIESISSISTEELWNTARSKPITSGEVVVQQLANDSETTSARGKWHSCSLVLIGIFGTGIRPVAVRL